MDRVTVYHNPHCRSSVTGLELARALAGEANVDVVLYMKQPLKLDYLWAALCMLGAVYFIFRN